LQESVTEVRDARMALSLMPKEQSFIGGMLNLKQMLCNIGISNPANE
jgi:hypothetical protein